MMATMNILRTCCLNTIWKPIAGNKQMKVNIPKKAVKLKVGFTGTQKGMTQAQKEKIRELLVGLIQAFEIIELHHGDCIGADEDAYKISDYLLSVRTVAHPPANKKKRAFTYSNEILEALPYLVRNKKIVDETDLLIAAPDSKEEKLRSGTWSTIRYAQKCGELIVLVYPDGTRGE
jgi:hypothetical protein